MLNTVLYYELAMKVPIPVGITVYLLTWGLGHLRCLVYIDSSSLKPVKGVSLTSAARMLCGHLPAANDIS